MKYSMCENLQSKNSLSNGTLERARVSKSLTIPNRSQSSERGFGCIFSNKICVFSTDTCLYSFEKCLYFKTKEASLNRFQLLRPATNYTKRENESRTKNARSALPCDGRPDRILKSGEGVLQERKSLGRIKAAALKVMLWDDEYPFIKNCLTWHLTNIRGEKAEVFLKNRKEEEN